MLLFSLIDGLGRASLLSTYVLAFTVPASLVAGEGELDPFVGGIG